MACGQAAIKGGLEAAAALGTVVTEVARAFEKARCSSGQLAGM